MAGACQSADKVQPVGLNRHKMNAFDILRVLVSQRMSQTTKKKILLKKGRSQILGQLCRKDQGCALGVTCLGLETGIHGEMPSGMETKVES